MSAPEEGIMVCSVCKKPCDTMCSGCYAALYCSVGCQKKSWDSGHSNICPEAPENVGMPWTDKQIRYFYSQGWHLSGHHLVIPHHGRR